MSKELNDFLFRGKGQHGLFSFRLTTDIIEISVVPWEGDRSLSTYLFNNARIIHASMVDNSPEELEMPWDIISIDERNNLNGIWEFTLHCSCISFTFLANWPIRS